MKGKRKSLIHTVLADRIKANKIVQKLLIFCPSIITHQFIGGNYDETFN